MISQLAIEPATVAALEVALEAEQETEQGSSASSSSESSSPSKGLSSGGAIGNPQNHMEELKDASIHHTALKLSEDIKAMKIYGSLYKMVQVGFLPSSIDCVIVMHLVFFGVLLFS